MPRRAQDDAVLTGWLTCVARPARAHADESVHASRAIPVATIRAEPPRMTGRAERSHDRGVLQHPRGHELIPIGPPEIQAPRTIVEPRFEHLVRPARPAKCIAHIRPDLIAAGSDGGSNCRHEVRRVGAEQLRQPLHGPPCDAVRRSAPAGVDCTDRTGGGVRNENWHTVGDPDGQQNVRIACHDAVRLVTAAQWTSRLQHPRAVNLAKPHDAVGCDRPELRQLLSPSGLASLARRRTGLRAGRPAVQRREPFAFEHPATLASYPAKTGCRDRRSVRRLLELVAERTHHVPL